MNPESVSEKNLFDSETQQCPYHAYKTLRDEAPVYQCPATGIYVIVPMLLGTIGKQVDVFEAVRAANNGCIRRGRRRH
jgi:hypothetical protein